jgi:hypothetical protein
MYHETITIIVVLVTWYVKVSFSFYYLLSFKIVSDAKFVTNFAYRSLLHRKARRTLILY